MLDPLKSGIQSSRLSTLNRPFLKEVFEFKLKALFFLNKVDTVIAIAHFILHNHLRFEVGKNANPLCIKGLAFALLSIKCFPVILHSAYNSDTFRQK